MLYLHSVSYYPSAEVGISLMDYRLSISWPEPLAAISDCDKIHMLLSATRLGLAS